MLDPLVSTNNISQQAAVNAVGPSHLGKTKTSAKPDANEAAHPATGLTGAGAVVSSSAVLAAQESAQTQARTSRPDITEQRQQTAINDDDGGTEVASEARRVQELYQDLSETDSQIRSQRRHETEARANVQSQHDGETRTEREAEARDHAPAPDVERNRAIAAYEAASDAGANTNEVHGDIAGLQMVEPFSGIDLIA